MNRLEFCVEWFFNIWYLVWWNSGTRGIAEILVMFSSSPFHPFQIFGEFPRILLKKLKPTGTSCTRLISWRVERKFGLLASTTWSRNSQRNSTTWASVPSGVLGSSCTISACCMPERTNLVVFSILIRFDWSRDVIFPRPTRLFKMTVLCSDFVSSTGWTLAMLVCRLLSMILRDNFQEFGRAGYVQVVWLICFLAFLHRQSTFFSPFCSTCEYAFIILAYVHPNEIFPDSFS